MVLLLEQNRTYESFPVTLEDGLSTTVHVAKFSREHIRPRLKLFEEETRLLDWCEEHDVADAIGGGFFLRDQHKPLGDLWIDGQEKDTVPFLDPWKDQRGSLYISELGTLAIAPRYLLPQEPSDLMQAGPLLVQDGASVINPGVDTEGFSAGASQFDSDITIERHPRSAIGVNDEHIFSVVCDGRSDTEAGMMLHEMAEVLVDLGVEQALNLDGGSSSCLIGDGELRNVPRTPSEIFERGRPIFSAIVFERI